MKTTDVSKQAETVDNCQQETILDEAARLTVGDRQSAYGHPSINFARIARLWRAHVSNRYDVDIPFDGADVAWMMVNVKQARDVETPRRDNLTDGAGYIRTIERIRAAAGEPGYVD